jgi:hypothetical protein
MRITCPQDDTAAEAVESLITGKRLMTRIVNETSRSSALGFNSSWKTGLLDMAWHHHLQKLYS